MNRPDLMDLLGHRVTITNPGGSSWTGKLVAVGNEPCLVIDQDRGPRICLPQSFAVAPADPPAPEPLAPWELELLDQQAAAIQRDNSLAERLDRAMANLQQYIDQRAQELAAPLFAQARAKVDEAREETRHWRTRFTDLQREMGRQNDVLYKRAARAEAAIARATATMRANTQPSPTHPTDYQHGYQACADHVRAALHGTDQQEADRG